MEELAYIKNLIQKARAAQQVFETFDQKAVDAVVKALGKSIYDNAEILSGEAVEQTGMGNLPSKIRKQQGVAVSHWSYLKDKKSVGMIEYDAAAQVATYAKPIGVVACITPTTNPTSTVCGNGMYALKCRNAMIVAPHPRAKKVTAHGVRIAREAIRKAGGPEDLLQVIEEPSIELTQLLMSNADVVIATGGPGMVKAAYSSGKPSFGVGQGNVQSIMDRGCQDLYEEYAAGTIRCRSTDNGIQCTAEQCIILPSEESEAICQIFAANGAYLIEDESVLDKMRHQLFEKSGDSHKINVEFVGKTACELGRYFGLHIPEDTQVLLVRAKGTAKTDPLCREKLCPITAYLTYETFEDGVEMAFENLTTEGAGHSTCIFSRSQAHIDHAANRLPVSRLMVNTAATVAGGNSFAIGYNPTISLGCGTWGNNAISENLTYKHLMNTTKVATLIENPINPTPEEVWAD